MKFKKTLQWSIIFSVLFVFTGYVAVSLWNPYRLGPEVALAVALEDSDSSVVLSNSRTRIPRFDLIADHTEKKREIVICHIDHEAFLRDLANSIGQDAASPIVLDEAAMQNAQVQEMMSKDSTRDSTICRKIEFIFRIPMMPIIHVS